MLQKIFIAFFIVLCFYNTAFSKEVIVKVVPEKEISTANGSLQEGDSIDMIASEDVYLDSKLFIKKGEPVRGIVTSLVNNDFTCQTASIYAENFKVKNVDGKIVKLKGIVYKSGRNHSYLTQYFPDTQVLPGLFFFVRGGEVKIVPDKDSFTLYFDSNKKQEVKNDL